MIVGINLAASQAAKYIIKKLTGKFMDDNSEHHAISVPLHEKARAAIDDFKRAPVRTLAELSDKHAADVNGLLVKEYTGIKITGPCTTTMFRTHADLYEISVTALATSADICAQASMGDPLLGSMAGGAIKGTIQSLGELPLARNAAKRVYRGIEEYTEEYAQALCETHESDQSDETLTNMLTSWMKALEDYNESYAHALCDSNDSQESSAYLPSSSNKATKDCAADLDASKRSTKNSKKKASKQTRRKRSKRGK